MRMGLMDVLVLDPRPSYNIKNGAEENLTLNDRFVHGGHF